MTDTTDTNVLLSRAQSGDQIAQNQLLTRHADRLRKMISLFLDPRVSARIDELDVLQEAMAIAAVRLPDYLESQPIAFYPWLRQIVQEQLVTAHRRHVQAQRRSVTRENRFLRISLSGASAVALADRLVSSESSPSKKADREESRELINVALHELPEAERELLLMRYVEQLTIPEIADVLGITHASAKSRVRRALEKLNRHLGGSLDQS